MMSRLPKSKRPAFLAAATADYSIARGVMLQLAKAGRDCFFCDEAQLRAVDRGYLATVDRELEAAGVLLVVAGHRDRVESEWVRYAWRGFSAVKGQIVTMLADGMRAEELPRRLRKGACLRFPEEGDHLESVLSGQSVPGAARNAPQHAKPWNQLAVAVTLVNLCILGAVVWLLRDRFAGGQEKSGPEEAAGADQRSGGRRGSGPLSGGNSPTRIAAGSGEAVPGSSPAGGDAGIHPNVHDAQSTTGSAAEKELIEDVLEGEPAPGALFSVAIGAGIQQPFSFIPSGTFFMGSPEAETGREADEMPREVRISEGFWMARTECSVSLWHAVMGGQPAAGTEPGIPVTSVSREEVAGETGSFLARLNSRSLLQAGWKFSLPSEEQWEYACRAGTTTPFHFGSSLDGTQANCDGGLPYGTETGGPFLNRVQTCGSYPPNALGLHDMHGNVWEWCGRQVRRGGGWRFGASQCRAANREVASDTSGDDTLGFRIAIVMVDAGGF